MAKARVLLVDDEPGSIEETRRPLLAAGYAVEVVLDGVAGLEAFHRLSPDAVVVEAMLPRKHGFDVCREIKATTLGRSTPVLIASGVYRGEAYREQAIRNFGCDAYLEKPLDGPGLLEELERLLGSRSPERNTSGASVTPVDRSVPDPDRELSTHDVEAQLDALFAEAAGEPDGPDPARSDGLLEEIEDALAARFGPSPGSEPGGIPASSTDDVSPGSAALEPVPAIAGTARRPSPRPRPDPLAAAARSAVEAAREAVGRSERAARLASLASGLPSGAVPVAGGPDPADTMPRRVRPHGPTEAGSGGDRRSVPRWIWIALAVAAFVVVDAVALFVLTRDRATELPRVDVAGAGQRGASVPPAPVASDPAFPPTRAPMPMPTTTPTSVPVDSTSDAAPAAVSTARTASAEPRREEAPPVARTLVPEPWEAQRPEVAPAAGDEALRTEASAAPVASVEPAARQVFDAEAVDRPPEPEAVIAPDVPDAIRFAIDPPEVRVRVRVGTIGEVLAVEVTRGVPGAAWVDARVVSAVERWVFRPAENDGRSVECWVDQVVRLRP